MKSANCSRHIEKEASGTHWCFYPVEVGAYVGMDLPVTNLASIWTQLHTMRGFVDLSGIDLLVCFSAVSVGFRAGVELSEP